MLLIVARANNTDVLKKVLYHWLRISSTLLLLLLYRLSNVISPVGTMMIQWHVRISQQWQWWCYCVSHPYSLIYNDNHWLQMLVPCTWWLVILVILHRPLADVQWPDTVPYSYQSQLPQLGGYWYCTTNRRRREEMGLVLCCRSSCSGPGPGCDQLSDCVSGITRGLFVSSCSTSEVL